MGRESRGRWVTEDGSSLGVSDKGEILGSEAGSLRERWAGQSMGARGR